MDYQIQHSTYTECIKEMERIVSKSGFELDTDEQFSTVGINTKRPKTGETVRFSLSLSKSGKVIKKGVHVQVYGMPNDMYELNCYIL
jgi:hypothetical protein